MADLIGTPQFTDRVRQLETTDPKHPDTWNPNNQLLINNDVYLDERIDETDESVDSLTQRLELMESSSAIAIQRAVKLDWLYRDNRFALELWSPNYTLIDTVDIAITGGVAGDDSLDVVSTETLKNGEYYVLSAAATESNPTVSVLIKVVSILSETRIRISNNLQHSISTGTLSRCSLDVTALSHATGQPGQIWLSKRINIDAVNSDSGAVVIRRSLNSGSARLYYIDSKTSVWTERGWSLQRSGGEIPDGFADYEYVLPMEGDGYLRLDIEGEAMEIPHIIALGEPTGLGGLINTAMRPSTPIINGPVNGGTGISARPMLSIASYSSPSGTPQESIRFFLALNTSQTVVMYDSGELPAGLTHQTPANLLAPSTAYRLSAQVKDAAGLWSPVSTKTVFTTAAATAPEMTSYVATPSVVSPANGATEVSETTTIQGSQFATVGSTETQVARQYRIRAAAGNWTAPLWDSGEETVNKTSYPVPAGVMQMGGLTYYVQIRDKGATSGWSEWSPESKMITRTHTSGTIGVALTQNGASGVLTHVDVNGATIATPNAEYFSAHPVFGAIKDVIVDGQHMVIIRKFWVKRGVIGGGENAGKEAWWISDVAQSGFHVHPAFRKDGADIQQIYISKYSAVIEDYVAVSQPGILSNAIKSFDQYKAAIDARNTAGVTGFMMWSIYHIAALQFLYLVEKCSFDSQSKTGFGAGLPNQKFNTDNANALKASYRGVVGLWNSSQHYIDGIKSIDGIVHLWDTNGNKTWTATARPSALGAGYPVTFMQGSGSGWDLKDVFIADTVSTDPGSAIAPDLQQVFLTDTYYAMTRAGGAFAGLFDLYGYQNQAHTDHAPTNTHYNTTRLARI